MIVEWKIQPGETILRRDIHKSYGGAWYGGIEPSATTPNVLLFSSDAGAKYGYDFDGWHSDGTFHYTGEGRLADQVMKSGNRAVRDHLLRGRALRLFESVGTSSTYVGEFDLPNESHILLDEAPDEAEQLRSVFVFRLNPVGQPWINPNNEAPKATLSQLVPLEATNIEAYVIERQATESAISLRREARLVHEYVDWLATAGLVQTARQAIATPAGHLMYTDLFVQETQELIEAKSSSSRHHIRAALGQILDYSRYVDHLTLAVLTPTKPAHELVTLLVAHGIHAIWRTDGGAFEREGPPNIWGAVNQLT